LQFEAAKEGEGLHALATAIYVVAHEDVRVFRGGVQGEQMQEIGELAMEVAADDDRGGVDRYYVLLSGENLREGGAEGQDGGDVQEVARTETLHAALNVDHLGEIVE
jgi:hypothetical protein